MHFQKLTLNVSFEFTNEVDLEELVIVSSHNVFTISK